MLDDRLRVRLARLLLASSVLLLVGAVVIGSPQIALAAVAGGIGSLLMLTRGERTVQQIAQEQRWGIILTMAVVATLAVASIAVTSSEARLIVLAAGLAMVTVAVLVLSRQRTQ